MSELHPDRPLPWKAVQIGGVWDVTNAAGDAREEFSVCEYMTEGEARFVARAANAHADLLAACDKAEGFVKYALEFWDWRNFPNLEESAQLLLKQLQEAIAKAEPECPC